MEINLTAPSQVVDLLKSFGLTPDRSIGQNFLIDGNILGKIIEAAELAPEDCVLEVGPGLGTLTRELAGAAGRVWAVEIDTRLKPVLDLTLEGRNNINLLFSDVLDLDLRSTLVGPDNDNPGGCKAFKAVANIPYNITGPLVYRILSSGLFSRTLLMVQNEVAQRMVAHAGAKDYGALTLVVNYYTVPSVLFRVSPGSFLPQPEVESAVVRLDSRQIPPAGVPPAPFLSLVRIAFRYRRKRLRKALVMGYGQNLAGVIDEALKSSGVEGDRRGETLNVEEFGRLARVLYNMKVFSELTESVDTDMNVF